MTAEVVPALTDLYVYVTDCCNCSCQHCWIVAASAKDETAGRFLSPDIFEAAAAEAVPLGLRSVKWTGGEPTIHPHLPQLLEVQRRLGLRGTMETNAMEVTPALARLLAASGISHVSVSLDGAQADTHDAIRGRPGAQRRALAGIRNLVRAGFAPQIIMSLMTDNISELEALLYLALQIGAGSVKLNVVQPIRRGEEIHAGGRALPVADVLALAKRLEARLRDRIPLPVFLDVPMAFRSLREIATGVGCWVCGIKNILGLLADGSYALCGIGSSLPEMTFGRAGSGDLLRIWSSHPVLRSIRANLPGGLEGVCGRCLLRTACLGACVAQNYYRSRNVLAPYWFCKEAEELGLFPRNRLLSARPET